MKRESQRTYPALLSRLGRHTVSQAPHPCNTIELADTPNAVGLARLHAVDVLSRWGVPAEVAETARLLVSELVTNAVRHPQEGEAQPSAYSSRYSARTFELTLEKLWDAVRVSVWDRDSRPPVLKKVGVEAEGGRGIFIVAVMSRSWGYHPAVGIPGKVVWAETGLVPAGGADADEVTARIPGRPPSSESGAPRAVPPDPNLLGRVLVGIRDS
ncbi:ATP-binding protein [Streptomyces sp. RB110-1]|uniref:ATP-binding protein n=1 Tax=unclassified Streptomyces TaxID=2593676 RepID=UPI0019022091|nr:MULTISPECIES: ATP-binding protein [unclassified Streptomyces]MBK0372937.1 ATP-binding protein [Streptomyces sp. RB110-1]MBK0390695.1 ATP-binding protein [Streptomyces sp. RB110-2]